MQRACSKAEITVEAFKAAVSIRGASDEWRKWFFEIFKEMDKNDRSLTLKFMSGNSRINQGQHYSIDVSSYQAKDGFPEGHTCGSNMVIPEYSSKEMMKQRLLT